MCGRRKAPPVAHLSSATAAVTSLRGRAAAAGYDGGTTELLTWARAWTLLQVASINAAMSSLIKTLNVFPRERSIVTRERSKKVPLPRSGHHAPVLLHAWRFLTGGSAHSGCASSRSRG